MFCRPTENSSWLITIALFLDLIVFGFYGFQGIRDQINYIEHYEVYKDGTLFSFKNWAFVLGIPSVAILSIVGLFKKRWAGLIVSMAGICLFLFMTHGFIEWYFDPMEQGRNGGVLNLAAVAFSLACFNLGAFILLLK